MKGADGNPRGLARQVHGHAERGNGPGARTMAMDYENNVAYLVTAQREAKPPAPGQRPAMVPGSFELIVVKP